MIKAAIFDMDGLLINSEPFWQQAQIEVFPTIGVNITHEDTIKTTGIRVDQIVDIYCTEYPWHGYNNQEICDLILARVIELVQEFKPMMPGVLHAISTCEQLGLPIALASSSPMTLINATLEALELDIVFTEVLSAEKLPYGKPHPEIYLNAANALGVSPQECVAFEDSLVGLLAAKSAQMTTVVVPDIHHADRPQFSIADYQLESLYDLTAEHLS